MDGIARYFAAERAESLLFVAVGVLALAAGLYFLMRRRARFLKGMAGPLIARSLASWSSARSAAAAARSLRPRRRR